MNKTTERYAAVEILPASKMRKEVKRINFFAKVQ